MCRAAKRKTLYVMVHYEHPGEGIQMADTEPPGDAPKPATALAVIEPAPSSAMVVPAMVADLGEAAALRFIDFFTANIRNPNTRAAYAVAVRSFFRWLEKRGVHELSAIRTHHVSAYVEVLTRTYKAPTVKQHLAAIRMLFDWLIVGQVVSQNPAAAVRGPKHVVKKGKTPVLDGDKAKQLLASIDISTVVGLRDRALIGLLISLLSGLGGCEFWLSLKQLYYMGSHLRNPTDDVIFLMNYLKIGRVARIRCVVSRGLSDPIN